MKEIKSLLFVPAEERRLKKIKEINADAYIIDLEDSIADEDKDAALYRTIDYLNSNEEHNIFVRINRHRYLNEINKLKCFDIGFMLPKIETEDDYADAKAAFEDRHIIALIETPMGLMNAGSIASFPWVTALSFGAEDFSAAVNMRNSIETLSVFKSMLVLAAKANNKFVFDTPCFSLKDEAAFYEETQQAVNMGFDGKTAIHPRQVGVINRLFWLNDPEYIKRIISEYEAAGNAVCEIDGKVYEKLHIDRMRKIINEADSKNE